MEYFIAPDDASAASVVLSSPEGLYPLRDVGLNVLVMLPSLVELVTGSKPPTPGSREPLAMEDEGVVDVVHPAEVATLVSITDDQIPGLAARWVSEEDDFDSEEARWVLEQMVPLAREGAAKGWSMYFWVMP